ncbi:L-gulonolactone oxidase [Callorhinchus milii]|uniref:L-gulonolactone oxidase n=1 Tax=Callorhinchus milii TaxID=7868 RepID=V9KW47_CALMI|nr:L-gulonolactone oxidase [Callorhinchus milii]|eukprot:gi/632987167/ref/XP_007910642.1/ PREDICTED: L-gulonolactone oxidase-like [Callorhinchus milii]
MAQLGGMEGHRFLNWAKTYSCEPELYFEPTSVEEVRQILLLAKQRCKRVKVVGEGHSPSDIACTEGYLIKLNKLNRLLKVDVMKQQVTVEAGILLTELNEDLTQHGLALSNMGAVSDVTAGGVIATGTHNTGIRHGILATQVVSLCLMTAAGEVLECSEQQNQEVFRAASLHLGCLGVVLTLTIQCQPAFLIHQRRFPASLTQVLTELDDHLQRSEYFRFLWFPHTDNVNVYYSDRTDKPLKCSSNWFRDYAVGYYLLELLLWVSFFLPWLTTWITRAYFWAIYSVRQEQVQRSDRAFSCECLFKQYVSDWAIPIHRAGEALRQLQVWLGRHEGETAHFPVEVRFARGDDILLSPCYRQDSCYINIIAYRPYGREPQRERYWAAYEAIMRENGGRPHWAKAHSCVREDFEKMYPGFRTFCSIRERLDPTGMFLNAYLERTFF